MWPLQLYFVLNEGVIREAGRGGRDAGQGGLPRPYERPTKREGTVGRPVPPHTGTLWARRPPSCPPPSQTAVLPSGIIN